MASDRQQFAHAMTRHEELLQAGELSVPPEEGYVGVFVADSTCHDENEEDVEERALEGELIVSELERDGQSAELFIGHEPTDFEDLLLDRNASDIIVIGHGNLSSIYFEHVGSDSPTYDWRDVSATMDHLKQGQFLQRFCGNANRHLPVPLGLFAVSDFANLIVPFDTSFIPKRWNDETEDQKLRPITAQLAISYQGFKEFGITQIPPRREDSANAPAPPEPGFIEELVEAPVSSGGREHDVFSPYVGAVAHMAVQHALLGDLLGLGYGLPF